MFKGLRKQIVLNITASEEEYSTASLQWVGVITDS